MAKRFYICPVVGDGTFENPYRAAISNALTENGSGLSAVIASNPDGTPKFPFAFVIASAQNHDPILAVPGTDAFPELTLDATLNTLPNNLRTRLLNFLSNRGVDTSGLGPQSTFREVIERIGLYLDANFSTTHFDVRGN